MRISELVAIAAMLSMTEAKMEVLRLAVDAPIWWTLGPFLLMVGYVVFLTLVQCFVVQPAQPPYRGLALVVFSTLWSVLVIAALGYGLFQLLAGIGGVLAAATVIESEAAGSRQVMGAVMGLGAACFFLWGAREHSPLAIVRSWHEDAA